MNVIQPPKRKPSILDAAEAVGECHGSNNQVWHAQGALCQDTAQSAADGRT